MSQPFGNVGLTEVVAVANELGLRFTQWIEWDDTFPFTIKTGFAANTYVHTLDVFVHTAFDGASNVLTVGTDGDVDGYIPALSLASAPVSARRDRNHSPGALINTVETSSRNVVCDIDDLTGATAGKALIVVWYADVPPVP